MRDVGLMTGVKALWQEDVLSDYTVKVQGQQFKAHKVVLAAVSHFFKGLLSKGFIESNMDEVELKGLNADIISKVLQLIYTGDEEIIATDVLEVLKCAMYLQMPLVADICVEKMLESLNHKNCLDLYSVFTEYSFREAVEKVENFIRKKWKTVLELCNLKEMSLDGLQVIRKYWKRSEWEMFLFIKNWFEADPEDRKCYTGELLSDVRFGLISPQMLTSITEMSMFTNVDGPWHDLVEQALHYHQLPTHLKVVEQSDQSKVRTEPSPALFTSEEPSTVFALDEKNKWKKYDKKAQNVPKFEKYEWPVGIEVNNYFIISSQTYGAQKWYILDPRTLTWSKMADLEKYRAGFVLVHHGEYLYAVGGSTRTGSDDPDPQYDWVPSFEMEMYSFRENAWSSVEVPFSFCNIAACVLGDKIYISGGRIRHINEEESLRSLYSLDLSSPNQEWEQKAKFTLWESLEQHNMVVVCIDDEDVLLVVVEDMFMYYYSPAKDKWFDFRYSYTGRKKNNTSHFSTRGMLPARGNHLYVLNAHLFCYSSDTSESDSDFDMEAHHMKDRTSLKWKISKIGKHVTDIPVENFPLSPRPSDECEATYFAALLAIPL